jgi:iron complex outermembrane recepter protein
MKKNQPLLLQCMKISLVQLVIAVVFMGIAVAKKADAQELLEKRVTLQLVDMRIKTVLAEIEKSANVRFSYSPQIIQSNRRINVELKNSRLDDVLKKVFLPLNIHYKVAGNQIILIKSSTPKGMVFDEKTSTTSLPNELSQLQAVTGKVTDEKGEALVGVSVIVKGSARGTTTDSKGIYGIEASANDVLVFSFVGYKKQEVLVGTKSTLDVRLVVDNQELEEVVVTGVFDARTRLEASNAISIMKTKDIERVAATSGADYLKNIPGVFVDASAGETRNTIMTRGLTLFPAAMGYNYVSMQEDGLPMSNLNYGTDNFLRPDVTTARIEALRGGSASITGPNAPGGIFNYISKTGGEKLEGEARVKFGLEGDGKNPYYRADLGIGGPLNADKSLRFYVGGFLRYSNGARYAGYLANNGGQFKANVSKTYSKGSVKLYLKYLNDHNAVTASTPTESWSNQRFSPGFNFTDSYDVPSIQGKISRNGEIIDYDSRKKHHSNEKAVGLTWAHTLGEGLELKLASRISDRKYLHHGTTIVAPFIPTAAIFYILPGLAGRFGVYTFTDKVTGKVLGTFDRQPGKPIVAGANNNFPGINNQVLFMPAFMSQRDLSDFSNQITLSKKLKNMSFTAGAYYAKSKMDAIGVNTGSGPGAATMENIPHMIDIKLASNDGKTYQVTSPEGFMKVDEAGQNTSLAKQDQFSLFFAHEWTLAKGLTLDWGLRYEHVKNYGWNAVTVPINTTDVVTFGGLDNNPLTLYDNFGGSKGPELNYTKYAKYLAYSASLNYKISDNQAVYIRVSNGGKSADVNTLTSLLNTQFNIDNTKEEDLQQKVEQFEVAYKFSNNGLKLFLTPFYSKLSNVANISYFRNVDNTAYAPPVQFNTFVTKGIEIEADWDLTKNVGVRVSALFQESKATIYTTWIANANGPQDDVLLNFSGNNAGGVPPVLFNIAPRFTKGDFFAILSYNHLSKRPANTPNGFEMKGYNNVDFSAGYTFNKRLSLQFNINNLLNSDGVMNWLGSGGFPTSLNRDRITPQYVRDNPNDTYSTLRNMPRAYFLTASFKF